MTVKFKVTGQPQGKARPRFSKGRVYTPSSTKDYETRVRKAYQTVSGGISFEVSPVSVSIKAYLTRAKTNRRKYAVSKPDIDNIIKAVLDGLNGVAFCDDRQVINITAIKLYCESPEDMPYTEIEITDGE